MKSFFSGLVIFLVGVVPAWAQSPEMVADTGVACSVVDDIGMYAPRGELSETPYEYPSTAIAFYYHGVNYYIPIDDSCDLSNIDLHDTACMTIVTLPDRVGYYGEKPMQLIVGIERVKSPSTHDTLCRLIQAFDTLYVTDADAKWYCVSKVAQDHFTTMDLGEPVWILQMSEKLCRRVDGNFPAGVAEYYARGNRMWYRMKPYKHHLDKDGSFLYPEYVSNCELWFVFKDEF